MHPKEIARKGVKKYKAAHRLLGLCVWCDEKRDKSKTFCEIHRQQSLRYQIRRAEIIKQKVLAFYGAFCACCLETNEKFLTVDHMNNDGAKQRRENPGSSYMNAYKAHFPLDLQILCYNCNCGKYVNHDICPHKKSDSGRTQEWNG